MEYPKDPSPELIQSIREMVDKINRRVELSGDEREEVFMKFEGKTPSDSKNSLHVMCDIHFDENGTEYQICYPISSEEYNHDNVWIYKIVK